MSDPSNPNSIVPDRPAGDSTAAAANTKFVTTAGANLLASNNTWTGTNTFNPVTGDALTVNPAASSFAKGFNITQSSAAASQAGPINFNLFSVTYSGTATGSGNDSFGLALADVNGLRINFTNSSTNNTQNGVSAFSAAVRSTVGGPQVIGGNFSNYSNVAGMGPMFGGVSQVWLDTGGTGSIVIGHEADVGAVTGGATYRIGFNVASPLATGTGTTLDSAYTISASGSNAPWGKGFTLSKNLYGAAPIATGGDWFFVDAAMTVANVFNASNLTVGTNIMVFKNFTVDNLGGIVSGSSASSTGVIQLQPSINGTGNATNIDVRNAAQVASSTGTEISFEANEAGRTTVRYGLTLGNWAEFTAFGGGANGLVMGTFTAIPFVFGTNNAERMRISSAGGLSVGLTTDPGIGVVSALNGFLVTTAAKTLTLKQGANGTVGTFVCNGSTPVTVTNSNVAITDAIIVSLNTVGGTVGALPAVKTITGASGFTIAGTAADTSTYNYAIIKNAA